MKILLISMVFVMAGCAQIIVKTDDVTVQINTLFKDIDFDRVRVLEVFEIEKYRGESKDVTAITPVGALSTEGGE